MGFKEDRELARANLGSMHLQKGDAYIIGEAGSCHDRFFNEARGMIWICADAGADSDAIKFQYFHSGKAVAAKRKAPEYAELYERYRLPAEWLPDLQKEAKAEGLDFLCTVYLTEDIEVVAPYVDMFKIASC